MRGGSWLQLASGKSIEPVPDIRRVGSTVHSADESSQNLSNFFTLKILNWLLSSDLYGFTILNLDLVIKYEF